MCHINLSSLLFLWTDTGKGNETATRSDILEDNPPFDSDRPKESPHPVNHTDELPPDYPRLPPEGKEFPDVTSNCVSADPSSPEDAPQDISQQLPFEDPISVNLELEPATHQDLEPIFLSDDTSENLLTLDIMNGLSQDDTLHSPGSYVSLRGRRSSLGSLSDMSDSSRKSFAPLQARGERRASIMDVLEQRRRDSSGGSKLKGLQIPPRKSASVSQAELPVVGLPTIQDNSKLNSMKLLPKPQRRMSYQPLFPERVILKPKTESSTSSAAVPLRAKVTAGLDFASKDKERGGLLKPMMTPRNRNSWAGSLHPNMDGNKIETENETECRITKCDQNANNISNHVNTEKAVSEPIPVPSLRIKSKPSVPETSPPENNPVPSPRRKKSSSQDPESPIQDSLQSSVFTPPEESLTPPHPAPKPRSSACNESPPKQVTEPKTEEEVFQKSAVSLEFMQPIEILKDEEVDTPDLPSSPAPPVPASAIPNSNSDLCNAEDDPDELAPLPPSTAPPAIPSTPPPPIPAALPPLNPPVEEAPRAQIVIKHPSRDLRDSGIVEMDHNDLEKANQSQESINPCDLSSEELDTSFKVDSSPRRHSESMNKSSLNQSKEDLFSEGRGSLMSSPDPVNIPLSPTPSDTDSGFDFSKLENGTKTENGGEAFEHPFSVAFFLKSESHLLRDYVSFLLQMRSLPSSQLPFPMELMP